jgi:malonyl CoA-acyl carrier protein transacylase
MRIVPLTVSAPFHSRHMAAVEAEFRQVLDAARPDFDAGRATHVTSNFTGGFHTGRLDDLIEALTRQVSGPVRWRDNMVTLAAQATAVVEVGPNRPLAAFFRTQGVSVSSILDLRSAARALGQTPARQEAP